MINSIGSDWAEHLRSGFPPTDRIYSDFRLLEYPDLETGSAAYTLAREDNLIDRGNCESATAPMMFGETVPLVANVTWARSNEQQHGGDYSFKGTITNGALSSYFYLCENTTASDMHGYVAGESYEYSLWPYLPSGLTLGASDLRFHIYAYYSASWREVVNVAPTGTDAFEELSGSFTIPAAATGVFIRWSVAAGGGASTDYFYCDDVRLTSHTVPGSHYLSSGYVETLCPMTETFTLQIKFKPNFAYDTASNQFIASFYVSATQEFRIYYAQAADIFVILWEDGGNYRQLLSAQYDDGTAHRNINQWITQTASIDLSTGTTAGSSLWLDKTQDDTTWTGNIDALSTEFNKLQIRAYNGTTGDYDIAYVRLFPNYVATDADVQNDFKDVANEEIFWSMDGHGTGRTRCNVTRFVRSITTTKNVENPANGSQGANRVSFSLNNTAGEFSDDQYAAYAPESDQFNGTVDQKYLQRRSNITIENWYDGDFDTVFFGKLTSGKYQRQTANQFVGVAFCSAEDYVGMIARQSVRRGRYWEDYDLVDTATESESLLHLITRLATKKEVYNYLSNSSFENATIGNSWLVSGGALNRDAADGFFGSCSGELIPGAGDEQAYQEVTFTGNKKFNVGETWTFYVWLKSTAAAADVANYIALFEQGSGSDSDTEAYELAGGEGYKLFAVSHTITNADNDEMKVVVGAAATQTINIDAAHLIRGSRALNYFVLNDNDGVAGVSDADDADYDSYDTLGFDVQDVAITHPWRRVESNESIWDYHKNLGNATVANYIGLNSAGTYRFRSRLSSDYEDPVPMGTLEETQGAAVEIDVREANKIIVHGVSINKSERNYYVWDAGASNVFESDEYGSLNQTVSTGATWPPSTTYGDEFIAKYGESDKAEVTKHAEWDSPLVVVDGVAYSTGEIDDIFEEYRTIY